MTEPLRTPESTGFNDLAIAPDGTVYASQTGADDPATWRIYRLTQGGQSEVLIQGAPLNRPNGVAVDSEGKVQGVIRGGEVLALIEEARQIRQAAL